MEAMDWARLIVDGIDSLAWPAVALSALVLLRKQLRRGVTDASTRLLKAKLPGGMELDFAEVLASRPILEGPAATTDDTPGAAARLDPDLAPATVRDLLSYEYARVIEHLGKSVLPRDVPAPRLGHGSVSGVLDLAAVEVTPNVRDVGEMIDDLGVRATSGEALNVGSARNPLRGLRAMETWANHRAPLVSRD